MAVSRGYLYDQGWQHERERLLALEELFDPASHHFIEMRGIAPGWRCLEVGFGAGGIATWLADRVGPSGDVLAIDLDTRFLSSVTRKNLRVQRQDLLADALEDSGTFDLAHARAVIEHIPDQRAALHRLLTAVRPGGWVVVEDIDLAGPVMAAVSERYAWPVAARPPFRKCLESLQVVLSQGDADPGCGASLLSGLREAGFDEVGAELHAPIRYGGARSNCMRLTVEYLRPRLLATGLVDEYDVAAFLSLMDDTEFHSIPVFMVSAWGRRPDPAVGAAQIAQRSTER